MDIVQNMRKNIKKRFSQQKTHSCDHPQENPLQVERGLDCEKRKENTKFKINYGRNVIFQMRCTHNLKYIRVF